jgi:malonate transporter
LNSLLDVILPVFLLIGLGYGLTHLKWITFEMTDTVMRFSQSIAIPVLLFGSIARLDLKQNFHLGLFASFYIGAFSCFILAYLGSFYLFKRPQTDAVAIGFACMFSNSLLLGLPITERAYGTSALAANYAIVSLHAPLLYAFGITVMELVRQRGKDLSSRALAKQVARTILHQPLVFGLLLGFTLNFSTLPLPNFFWSAVDMLATAAIPAALFGLGGVLYQYRPEGDIKTILMAVVITLIIHPAITYTLGTKVFHLTTEQLRSAVLTAAMAPGVNAYLFSNMYGAARRVAASTVLLATVGTIFTAWGWLQILP